MYSCMAAYVGYLLDILQLLFYAVLDISMETYLGHLYTRYIPYRALYYMCVGIMLDRLDSDSSSRYVLLFKVLRYSIPVTPIGYWTN